MVPTAKMSREERSWVLYDVGNSAFVLVMITAIMPIFYKDIAAGHLTGAESTAHWGYANSAASLILALAAPILGAMADYRRRKKVFFLCFLGLGVSFNVALSFIGTGQWLLCLVFFILARAAGPVPTCFMMPSSSTSPPTSAWISFHPGAMPWAISAASFPFWRWWR